MDCAGNHCLWPCDDGNCSGSNRCFDIIFTIDLQASKGAENVSGRDLTMVNCKACDRRLVIRAKERAELHSSPALAFQIKVRNSHPAYRWPATWGPNYDWLPDQNHGGNLLNTTNLMLMQADPETFFLHPHYVAHALVLVRAGRIDPDWARARLIRQWRDAAPKRWLKAWDAGQ